MAVCRISDRLVVGDGWQAEECEYERGRKGNERGSGVKSLLTTLEGNEMTMATLHLLRMKL